MTELKTAKTKKKKYLLLLLCILLMSITIGYASLSQTLYINGTANANGSFGLKFTEANITESNGTDGSTVTISNNSDSLSINTNLEFPGAYNIVTAKIKNTGTVAAKLNSVNFTGTNDEDIDISYDHAVVGEIIQPDEIKDIVITVKWKETSQNPKTINFNATLDYVQATSN